jgi:hypothetical protein
MHPSTRCNSAPTGTIGMVALFAAGLLLERHPAAASPEPERVASGPAPAA